MPLEHGREEAKEILDDIDEITDELTECYEREPHVGLKKSPAILPKLAPLGLEVVLQPDL